MRTRALFKAGQRGFSLIEIIVVVAIMAVLGTVLVPQLLRYVNQNQAKACQVDREGILAVYARCIYEESKELTTADLDNVMKGLDAATQHEIHQFDKCPSGGTYSALVDGDVAIIKCDCDGHEEVVTDFAAWSGSELAEGIDNPYDPATFPSAPEPEGTTTEESSSTDEDDPYDSGVWPYEDDPRWDSVGRVPGAYLEIDVPVKFRTRDGNIYVITDRNNTGKYKVEWEDNRGPEYIDVQGGSGVRFEDVVSYSGITIRDISTVLYSNIDPSDTSGMLTGINYGDIIIVDGKEYIYGTTSYADKIPVPTPGNTGNFYYVGEAEAVN